MKKFYLFISLGLLLISFVLVTCAKINKDQPCGQYNGTNNVLYLDINDKCYYIDNSNGEKVYVDRSVCKC